VPVHAPKLRQNRVARQSEARRHPLRSEGPRIAIIGGRHTNCDGQTLRALVCPGAGR
jgi:hypothetical protein